MYWLCIFHKPLSKTRKVSVSPTDSFGGFLLSRYFSLSFLRWLLSCLSVWDKVIPACLSSPKSVVQSFQFVHDSVLAVPSINFGFLLTPLHCHQFSQLYLFFFRHSLETAETRTHRERERERERKNQITNAIMFLICDYINNNRSNSERYLPYPERITISGWKWNWGGHIAVIQRAVNVKQFRSLYAGSFICYIWSTWWRNDIAELKPTRVFCFCWKFIASPPVRRRSKIFC